MSLRSTSDETQPRVR